MILFHILLRLSALAFYHSLQDPRLSRRFPRLCAYIRESCPKEREAKEELTLPRRVAHALDTSRLPELLTVERDPYVVSYAHTEPGTAAVIRAKQSVADDVTYAYFEVLVLDGGVQSTVAVRFHETPFVFVFVFPSRLNAYSSAWTCSC